MAANDNADVNSLECLQLTDTEMGQDQSFLNVSLAICTVYKIIEYICLFVNIYNHKINKLC